MKIIPLISFLLLSALTVDAQTSTEFSGYVGINSKGEVCGRFVEDKGDTYVLCVQDDIEVKNTF